MLNVVSAETDRLSTSARHQRERAKMVEQSANGGEGREGRLRWWWWWGVMKLSVDADGKLVCA